MARVAGGMGKAIHIGHFDPGHIVDCIQPRISLNKPPGILFEYYVDDAYPYAGPDMLAVKTDNYKLIDVFLENDIDELYDLQNDPGEMNNLINNPEFDEIEKELRDEMEILKKKYKYNPDRDWWLREVKK